MKTCKNTYCVSGLRHDSNGDFCPACNRLADRIMAKPDIEDCILSEPGQPTPDVREDPLGFTAGQYDLEPEDAAA